jgi:hypothetical protein
VVNSGGADIFFPVDFGVLRDLHRFFSVRVRVDVTGALVYPPMHMTVYVRT